MFKKNRFINTIALIYTDGQLYRTQKYAESTED